MIRQPKEINNIFRKLGIHTTEELIQRMKKQ